MQVIAHRGASEDAPENTIAAFELAVNQGADMIETDLHLTADGQIAIAHDAEVEGAAIGSLSLAELRARAPSVPTLDEALDAVGERVPWNLELKCGASADYEGLEALVLERVRAHGLLESTVFSSFSGSVLRRLREREPRARIGVLFARRWPFGLGGRVRALGAEAIHAPLSFTSGRRVSRWRQSGLGVRVYTVDREADQRQLIAWGVDGIFTNRPAALRALLGAAGSSKALSADER